MKGLHIDPERRLAWAQPGLTAPANTRRGRGRARPRHAVRRHRLGRHRRADARWRDRLAGAQVRPGHRRPRGRRDRHRRRPPDHRQRRTRIPDLFWAVRGGGGNFGVVTRFQFRLYPVGEILGGALFMPATRDVLRSLVPIAPSAPEELTTISFLMAPAARAVRPGRAGRHAVAGHHVRVGRRSRPTARPRSSRSARSRRRSSTWPCRCRTRASTRCSREAEQRAPGRPPVALPEHARRRCGRRHPRRRWPPRARRRRWSSCASSVARWPASRPTRRRSPTATPRSWPHHHRCTRIRRPSRPTSPGPRRSTRRSAPNGAGVYSNFLEAEGDERIRAAYPGGHLRAPGRRQAPLRPVEPVPPEPEHPAGRDGLNVWGSAPRGTRRPSSVSGASASVAFAPSASSPSAPSAAGSLRTRSPARPSGGWPSSSSTTAGGRSVKPVIGRPGIGSNGAAPGIASSSRRSSAPSSHVPARFEQAADHVAADIQARVAEGQPARRVAGTPRRWRRTARRARAATWRNRASAPPHLRRRTVRPLSPTLDADATDDADRGRAPDRRGGRRGPVVPSCDAIRADRAWRRRRAGFDSVWVFDHLLFRSDGEDERDPRVLDDPRRDRRGDEPGRARDDRACARRSATRRCRPRWRPPSTTSAAGG